MTAAPLLVARSRRPLADVLAELRQQAQAERQTLGLGAPSTLDPRSGTPADPGEVGQEWAGRAGRFSAPQAPGLVSLSTSDTRDPDAQVFEVVSDEMRLKRMRRRVCKAAEIHSNGMAGEGDRLQPAMVTLTYAALDGWRPRDLSEALKRVRQWLGRRGYRLRYVWVAELQERGAVHYHVLCWLPRGRGETPPFWDRQGWWPHGTSRCEWAYSPVGYMAKYQSKIDQKDRLPNGARMHGSGGFLPGERKAMSFHSRPTWARLLSSVLHRVTKPQGGGVAVHYACGLARRVASPFVLVARSSRRVIVARRDAHPDSVRAYLGEFLQCLAPSHA